MQNSGGDRCALILPNSAGEWFVEAIASILAAIGTPAPKQRGKSPGRAQGYHPSVRPRYPTVK